jgi:hypothetical protein
VSLARTTAPDKPVKVHLLGSGKAIYKRATAALTILLLALGMARFILALSSELRDDGIMIRTTTATVLEERRRVLARLEMMTKTPAKIRALS